jgi:5-oxoprolinase (ATP-hydrolysing) subunit A
MAGEGRVLATDGSDIDLEIDTICLHGDTPGSVQLARALRTGLEQAGVAVRRFSGPSR